MKFEYELNYDFVTGELTYKINKMPESLRYKGKIIDFCSNGHCWWIKSYQFPEILINSGSIYLRGRYTYRDDEKCIIKVSPEKAIEISDVLDQFQEWVENEYEEPKVEMTVAEIEKKLGIKNLKIVKES